ncbi:MAG: 3-oxoacyl-ACP synthase [Bacteroidetes bacterium]|nr:3-oxoacyl-ACP synthase [Bacteroidota bacterium]
MDAQQLKQFLYELCKKYIADGMAAASQTIADAREAANDDTKSSAGDKYETAREMMQQEIDLNTAHLNELQKLKAILDQVNPAVHSGVIQPGSIVCTSQGNYFIAISIGKLLVNNSTYYAVSASAPLAMRLLGQKAGDTVEFNDKEFRIHEVL